MSKQRLIPFGAGLLFFVLLASLWLAPATKVSAVPAAAPTPVTYSGQAGNNQKVAFFNGNITADTRACFDLSNFKAVDLQYILDQGTVNTTTVKLQWSNDNVNFEDTATVVSANAADAHGGNQFLLFGQYNCIYADVANTNTLGVKVFGVAK